MQKRQAVEIRAQDKVRIGGTAPSLPVRDSGKVRTGGTAPSLPRK